MWFFHYKEVEFQEYIIVSLTWVSLTLLAETDLKPTASWLEIWLLL